MTGEDNVAEVKEIRDLNDPELKIYTGLNEIQLKRYYEPKEGLFICESPKVIRRAFGAGYEPVSLLVEDKMLHGPDADIIERIAAVRTVGASSSAPVPETESVSFEESPVLIYKAPLEILVRLTGYHLTGGMLCAMRRKPFPSPEELLCHARRIAVFEDVENPTNIGAMFRSAAALGIDAVLLTGGCSDPLYRRAARVSVGTVFQIPWTWISPAQKEADPSGSSATNPAAYIDRLHALGFKTAALALTDRTIPIDDPQLKKEEKLAILLGNEGNGLLPETISKSDFVVKIPMPEGIDSLNVAAASAVAFWELRK